MHTNLEIRVNFSKYLYPYVTICISRKDTHPFFLEVVARLDVWQKNAEVLKDINVASIYCKRCNLTVKLQLSSLALEFQGW